MAKQYDPTRRFQTIPEATRTTGLSQCFIRNGCRNGSIPHVKSGNKYLVNIPLMLEWMDQQSIHNKAVPN